MENRNRYTQDFENENIEKKGLFNKLTFLHLRIGTVPKILISLAIMAILIAIVYFGKIPNPNMILIAGLVICSTLFGYPGGICAAVIMLGYTLFFFSTDNDFITFTPDNLQKVFVSIFGILVDMFFVCALKRRETQHLKEIQEMSLTLQEDNRILQEMSLVDSLTGIGNRLALRHDYDSYKNQDLYVMMMDIDDFKQINDKYGHAKGDEAIAKTGKALQECFPEGTCYRYGGDEFLVICRDTDEKRFLERLKKLMSMRPIISSAHGDPHYANYSIGFIRRHVGSGDDLRKMFSMADERMYESKHRGKGQIIGDHQVSF
ncbi:MAG: diguanylate cyclase [Parasporobacterium sp.]|nr:diguanylate cyclase [Parasporobacterium sp.]